METNQICEDGKHVNFGKISSTLTLTWCDISVWAKKKGQSTSRWKSFLSRPDYERTCIINNVSGIAKSGTLMAIMGASGAGKTTLLATISQRIKGEMAGEILVNGKAADQEFMTRISGFVPQQDLAIDSLTVMEHMEFMARLMMDRNVRRHQRRCRIAALLSELGLTKCTYTRLAKLSGGERKRLSLAVQLLIDPPLLFCDEPTTGLDSYNAGIVVAKLRLLAEGGKTVISTIHQPASGIFELFSHVVLLAGGRVAYQGDVLGAQKHFLGLGLICPPTYNQAEYFVSQLAVHPGREEQCHRKIEWLCDQFISSAYGGELMEQVAITSGKPRSILTLSTGSLKHCTSITNSLYEDEDDFTQFLTQQSPRLYTQFYWLAWRSIIDMKRNASHMLLQLGLYLGIALLISLPYVGLTVDQTGIQNLQGLMYLVITETIFTYNYSVSHTFPKEIPILLREISNGLYKPGPYYLSKIIILFPRAIIGPFLYAGLVFWIANLKGGFLGYIIFSIPVALSAISATAYGCLWSASFESVTTASLLSVPVDFISLIFSGLFLQLSSIPPHLSWIRYISNFYYGTEAVSILQWEQVASIECPHSPVVPCISTGEMVLLHYGYNPHHLYLDMAGLVCIYCISHLIGYIAICFRSKQQPVY
nr:ABCG transpoter Redboy [Hymenopus coronatus]